MSGWRTSQSVTSLPVPSSSLTAPDSAANSFRETPPKLLSASTLLGESEPLEGVVHMPEVNLQ